MDKMEYLKNITQYFTERYDVTTAYLFGSVVKKKTTPKSDVDIAILFIPGFNPFERFNKRLEIINDLDSILETKVDVIDLDSADLFFVHQVMLNKMLIVDKDSKRRVAFEVKKRRTYFDREHFYRLYHHQALKRLEQRGGEVKHG